MKPARESHERFGRDVRQILTAAEVGLDWGDNIGPTASFEYLNANAPYTVEVGSQRSVQAVFCLRARRKADGLSETGCRVLWALNGTALQVSVDVADTSSTYDVILGLMVS